ncbi:hypothetical protein TIFTF001_038540 [Ficus carica]|uniref:Uncharacterized protein n=1 Tax=Ficus carica TaxID=3494 RepID=A0AA88EBN6_FICCA|nr:hypothetical protein TIFTF001_038525 [Ficus carica]GMN69481.1 hypothetical protein TIFTF001_038531 [Ficus carica]GMN69484.1 hypothetical protein TIFTF001_038534 [Ficus carica]GMN69490.1 hypothetical protein TIFTF001_038540 [Ficus carica]
MSRGCEQESTASHIDQQQQQLHEYSSKDLHTAFGFIIGLLLTLVGVKYQGSGTTLFRQNRQIVSLFILTISLYATALVKTTLASRNDNHQSSNSYPAIFLIIGTFASELLLFILLTPLGWSLLNILALVFLAVQYGCHQTGTDRTTTELVPNSVRSLFAAIFNMSTSTPTTAGSGTDSHDVQMSNVV